jgi:hypothetical protein
MKITRIDNKYTRKNKISKLRQILQYLSGICCCHKKEDNLEIVHLTHLQSKFSTADSTNTDLSNTDTQVKKIGKYTYYTANSAHNPSNNDIIKYDSSAIDEDNEYIYSRDEDIY